MEMSAWELLTASLLTAMALLLEGRRSVLLHFALAFCFLPSTEFDASWLGRSRKTYPSPEDMSTKVTGWLVGGTVEGG